MPAAVCLMLAHAAPSVDPQSSRQRGAREEEMRKRGGEHVDFSGFVLVRQHRDDSNTVLNWSQWSTRLVILQSFAQISSHAYDVFEFYNKKSSMLCAPAYHFSGQGISGTLTVCQVPRNNTRVQKKDQMWDHLGFLIIAIKYCELAAK